MSLGYFIYKIKHENIIVKLNQVSNNTVSTCVLFQWEPGLVIVAHGTKVYEALSPNSDTEHLRAIQNTSEQYGIPHSVTEHLT